MHVWSARSTPQILSIKVVYISRFLNFLIIGLRSSSANSLLEIVSFLTVLPVVYLSKSV